MSVGCLQWCSWCYLIILPAHPSLVNPAFSLTDSCVIIVSARQLERWLKTLKVPNYCSLWKSKFLNSWSTKQLEYTDFLESFQAHTQHVCGGANGFALRGRWALAFLTIQMLWCIVVVLQGLHSIPTRRINYGVTLSVQVKV